MLCSCTDACVCVKGWALQRRDMVPYYRNPITNFHNSTSSFTHFLISVMWTEQHAISFIVVWTWLNIIVDFLRGFQWHNVNFYGECDVLGINAVYFGRIPLLSSETSADFYTGLNWEESCLHNLFSFLIFHTILVLPHCSSCSCTQGHWPVNEICLTMFSSWICNVKDVAQK